MIKAIACDVDGTLTDKNRMLSLVAIKAIRDAESAGYPVIISTGNVLPISYALHRFLGTTGPTVGENGCIVYNKGDVFNIGDGSEPRRAFADVEAKWDVEKLFTDQWRRNEVVIKTTPYLPMIMKFLEDYDIDVHDSHFGIHIVPRGVDKGTGLRYASGLMGIDISQIMAVGDGPNDIAMIETAGLGVAVNNASDLVKDCADEVTEKEYGEGFAEAVERFVLAK